MKFIIVALLFVAGVAYAANTPKEHQSGMEKFKILGGDTLKNVLDLKNLIPFILDAAKSIADQLRIGGVEALNLVLQTLTSLLGIVPTLVKQLPNLTGNLPAVMKRLPPIIDALKIVIDAAPELTKTLPEFVEKLPKLAESMVPTLKTTPDLLTIVPVVIEALPDLGNILIKLTPVIDVLRSGAAHAGSTGNTA